MIGSIAFSTANQGQFKAVLSRLNLSVLSESASIQGIETTPFVWGSDTESQGTARAVVHICDGLIKAGVILDQKGGFHVYDTHNDSNVLSFSDERVGKLKGGTDVIIAPYQVDESCLQSKLAVIIELKTLKSITSNASQFDDSSLRNQTVLELCSARCLSDQPGILAILTDLTTGAVAYEAVMEAGAGYFIRKVPLQLNQVYPYIAQFLGQYAIPDPLLPYAAVSDDPRLHDVTQFKRARLSVGQSTLAMEHWEELHGMTEPWSRERAMATRDLFQSLGVEYTPTVLEYAMMYT